MKAEPSIIIDTLHENEKKNYNKAILRIDPKINGTLKISVMHIPERSTAPSLLL